MKIYRFWAVSEIEENGKIIHFKAGSNESQEDACRNVEKNIATYHRYLNCEEEELLYQPDYEAPICEELVHTVDDHNLVTRNRYGALVLNSDDLLFLDIDDAPWSFFDWLGSLFSSKKTVKERILASIEKTAALPEFQSTGFRIYETSRGIRLLLSLPAAEWIHSGKFMGLARRFGADPLYAQLCVKQHCFRARLTPKPARIRMKTMLKFKFPYAEKDQPVIRKWLQEYQLKSESYNVCRLIERLGPEISGPAVEYHDKMTGVGGRLPLA